MDDSSMIYKRSLSSSSESVAIDKDVQELTFFWEHFLGTNNEKVRIEWLELFMFKYEVLITKPEFNADNQQFLSMIPSHFICYLLKLVYSIISELGVVNKIPITSANASSSNQLCIPNGMPSINDRDGLASLPYSTSISMATALGQDEILNELFRDDKDDASNDCSDESKRNDTKTIAALREFLAKGNGGRMLRILESLDLKGLLCSRELASVLVSFFPRSEWSSEKPVRDIDDVMNNEMADSMKLQNAIDEFEFHTRFYYARSEKSDSTDSLKDGPKKIAHNLHTYYEMSSMNSSTVEKSRISANVSTDIKPNLFQTDQFNVYEQRTQSCDYIGSTILNILQKLITNESNESLVQTSVTIKSLWFTIGQYRNIEQNQPFQSVNHEKIKRKLITITFMCLNKIFPSGKRLDELFNVEKLLARLMKAISIDYRNAEQQLRTMNGLMERTTDAQRNLTIKFDNLNALVYCLILIIQNMLINRNGEGNLFELLFEAMQQNISTLTKCVCLLTKVDRKQKNPHLEKMLHLLLKLIYILSNIEAQQDKSSQEKQKLKRKISVLAPPMASAHHKSYKLFKCMLESIVMHMAQEATADKMRIIFTFFRKYTICCCNINLLLVHRILKNSLDNKMHKICLNFVKQNVFRTVFMDDISCFNCDSINFIFEFKENFVSLYKAWFQYLNEPIEVIIFFKHIAKLSKYLHVDVQSHILVDIVLPVFRREKTKIVERLNGLTNDITGKTVLNDDIRTSANNDNDHLSEGSDDDDHDVDSSDSEIVVDASDFTDKLIICCLNIFLCYLKDVTVIKAFFIEENIQHLDELFVIPQFAYLVSNLLKIGVDNSQFLGETVEERLTLCQRLESLQIHLFSNIIDILVDLFNDMSTAFNFKLKQTTKNTNGTGSQMINQPNHILAKLQSNQLTIFEVLHLSVIYLNLILQIIRSSHDEFRGKVEQCLSSYENLQFNLVYNSLSCVLFMIQRQTNTETKNNSSIIVQQQQQQQQPQQQQQHQPIQMKQLPTEQQAIDLLNSSIISNLTLNDFEIVTTDELGIDFWSKCNNTTNIHSNHYTLTTTTPTTATTNDAYQTERSATERQVNNIFITNQCDIYSNKRFMTCINNERNGIFQLNTEIQSNSNLKMSPNDDCEQIITTIGSGSGSVDLNELNLTTQILNNVNNGHQPSLIYSSKNNNSNNNTKMLLSSIIERLKSGNSAAPNYNHIHLMIDSVQKLTHFVSKKVFGPIFNNDLAIAANATAAIAAVAAAAAAVADKQLNKPMNETNDSNDIDKQQLNDTDKRKIDTFNGQQLAPLNTNECKKLLMQLFEITLGVMLCGYKDRKADIEMSNALQELKQLLLSKTIGATFNAEKTKSIVDALLSLLKVAEMRNKCCFFDDCAHPTLARQNTFSLNISLENDRLLLLTGQSNQNETTTNDFYGQSDGDTTETDNSYETADEGYDADGEAAKCAETDIESDWSQSTASTTPLFRTHYVHEGICKIVIEILIDLSKRCLSNPNFGLNNLMQIATRLFSIRDVLGGPLYLIKGFANVLEIKEARLRDFQKSILDLITDLNTPDTLCAYLSLMTSENPPLDILLSRLIYLGNQGQSVHPSIEIEFPVACDAEIRYNCDRFTFDNIYKLYNGHEMQQIKSPFTQAAYIVPLNDLSFKPWTKDGFTFTSWLRLNSDQGSADIYHEQSNSIPDASEFEKNNDTNICSQHCVCKNKQHFISIGTNVMMLSIYLCVTNVNTMYFQITNPSVASHKGISKSHSEHFRCVDSMVVANGMKKPKNQPYNASNKRRRNYKKETPINNDAPTRPNRKPRSKENRKKVTEEPTSTSNVLAATRMAFKSSLSHFNLFSLNRQHDKENESNAVMCPIEIRGVKLHKNRWTLFSLAANFSDGEIQLQIFIDNILSAQINLPCSHFPNDTKKDKISVMCIGHKYSQPMTPLTPPIKIKDFSSPDFIQEAADLEAHSFRYSLSNVLLFRNKALDKEMLANLYALGPDCVNFAQCQIGNLIPNLGMPATSKVQATIPINEVLRTFREHLLVVYSAHKPDAVIGYKNVDEGETLEIIRFGCEAITKYIPSFHTALYLSGGLSPMLYLFARVVELSNSDVVQSAALQFLLKTAHSNSALYTEFIRQNYLSLIGAVIRTEKCLKTIRLLNAVLETACSASIISKGPDGFELSINKNICIVYADLFVGIINHYSDWHNPNAENCDIIEMLFSAIQSLVSEKHMHQALNISRLSRAKLVPALFNFCKIYLASGSQQQILLSKQAAESMVNIIRIFAGAPPAPALLDDIVKVLLMLHRPSNSFVTHDRSKFYFLLSSSTQQKPKKNGLPMTARKLSLSLRKSPKSSTDSILQRSTSLDQKMNKTSSNHLDRESSVQKNSSEETIMEVYPHHKHITDRTKYKFNYIGQSKSSEGSSNGLNSDKRTNINLNSNDKAKLERALSQLNRGRNKRLRKVRIKNKGRQRTLTDCETERDLKSKRRRKRSVSDSGIDLALFREYDIIADEELKKISGIIDVSDREDRYEPPLLSPSEMSQGIIQIQNGLLELLRDFIMILPDTAIEEVLSHYVTFDIILILANNQNACVRSSILRLLAVMCDRYSNCLKNIYFFHLGNQISLYKAEFSLVQCCVQWITGSLQNIDQLIQSGHFKVAQKFGLNPLIAIIPQTVHDISLAKSVFDFLCQLYNRADHEISSYMIDNGLIPAITKALARAYIKWGNDTDKLIDKIEELFCLIGRKAITTAGCINVLWDLLNSITYVEQNKGGATYRGIRSTQATVLLYLIQLFFPKQNNPTNLNFKLVLCDINLNDSALSASEKRTRLELLLDRTVQFVRAADLAHARTSEETKLIEAIVTLSMSGFSRGGSVIPWSFLPSNPMPLKLFIIKQIWKHTKNGDCALIGCDPKLVKAMIHSFWLNDGETIPKADVQALENVCRTLNIQQNAPNSYIPQAILKMDLAREGSLKEQKPSIDRTVYKFDSLAMSCVETAMKITRYVVEMQNSERRNAIAYIRVHDENCLKDEWNSIIDRMTHEGAPWYSQRTTMNSWELDPTEGPTRVRIRMRRCNLDIPSKFLLNDSDNRRNENYQPPLGYLKETFNQRSSCTFYDQVLYTFSCKHLQVDLEYEGDLIITETNLIFIPTDNSPKPTINVNMNAINEVWLRRYQHSDNAVEFFLETNTSIFLIFQSTNDREILKMYFADKILQCPEAKLNVITQQWREGQITNWEYLMTLNLISGRTYQDLMQYPVFPWILSDYESSTLDLNGIENYRILSKPIAIQHSSNESHYVNSYNYFNSLYTTSDSHQLSPYHYGSHYSNSGTVLHFLVRISPFTRYFLHYQDNNFDLPDRTFHSIVTTWRLASRDSTTDVKELIPEFFSFPEFLENAERFNFGVRQSGESVDNVELPPWARDSHRLFIFIHRQALESDIVRKNLHKWIDLVFGWRQCGQPAVEAINVFHPATYYGFSSSNFADPVERSAMETMVRTYGQMPKMLFKSPHPSGQSIYSGIENEKVPILKHIKGLHWGCYTGSMDLSDPHVCCLYQQFDVNLSHLMALPNTNVIYAFSDGHNVMQGNEPDTMNLIQWKQSDSIVRIKPLRDGESFDKKPLTYNHHIDDITTCGTDPNFNQLWFGHESGRITVYKCNNATQQSKYNNLFNLSAPFNRLSHNSALRKISMKFSNFNGESDCENSNSHADTIKWKDPVILIRHTNTVTAIHLSKEFKIAVSVACDGYAIIWDANNLNMVRSIQRPSICKSPISLVTVSSTLGDIVTVHDLFRDGQGYEDDRYSECCEATENIDDFVNVSVDMNGKSLLRLHTINAKYISHITIPEKILSVCYSYIKEGTGVNVIATGLENGIVRLWSSIDLSMIREFMVSTYDVLSLTYSTHQHLVVLTSDNIIQVWDSQGLHGNPPKFPQVVFQKRNSV